MTTRSLITTLAGLCLTAAAQADIIAQTNLAEITPPADVTGGAAENNNVRAFFESQTLLAADLPLEHVGVGFIDEDLDLVAGAAIAGTLVESYFIHWDPVGASGTATITASITFDTDIIGIAANEPALDATAAVVGVPATTYPTTGAVPTPALELSSTNDQLDISSDRRTITMNLTIGGAGLDQFRVITQSPTPGLVHDFNFEGNGIDSVTGVIAGQSSGGPLQFRDQGSGVPIALGRALSVGASTSSSRYLWVPQADFMNFADRRDFTIAFALRHVQGDTGSADSVLDAGTDNGGWQIRLQSSGTAIRFRDEAAGVNITAGGLDFGAANGEWHHLALVCDRSETDGARWYFDGQLVSSADATALGDLAPGISSILIGGDSGSSQGLDGQMARLRVWNFALSDAEVQAIAAEGGFFPPASSCPGDLDGDNDTDVFDFSILATDFGCTP